MSRYEWESGTILIPTKNYAKLRKLIIQKMIDYNEQQLNSSKKLKAFILERGKGKSKFDFQALAYDYASRFNVHEDTVEKMFSGESSTNKPATLMKKSFDVINTKTRHIQINENTSISFNDEDKSVRWRVGENNRSIDEAHQHPVSRELFNLLNSIVFTKTTGGVIVGNDEYNQDNENEGGGANYVNYHFESKVNKESRLEHESRGFGF